MGEKVQPAILVDDHHSTVRWLTIRQKCFNWRTFPL